jgi:predicted DsbA family dithiol-disulfide isomerase
MLLIRRLGVDSVPCFVVEGKYAVSGAQSLEVFQQIFDLVREEEEDTPAAAE